LVGRTVESVSRRGKYLLLGFSGGGTLAMHLGMSGRIVFGAAGRHTRFAMTVGAETMVFDDPRRFGRVGCPLPAFGPEPLTTDFTPDSLFASLRGRRAPVKALLLDQSVVAGVGNIYATEALYRAGLRPARAAKSLSREECARLCQAVKEVLALGVALRGSTLEDTAYLDPLGRPGGFQDKMAVYDRESCPKGHAVKATRRPMAGRTSLYCPSCQR
jgi:formamidopyrimidine-DNA glycosylase